MTNLNLNMNKLCEYQLWADSIVQNLVRELTEEEFTITVGPPFESVKNLCVHIVVAIEYNINSFVKRMDVDGEELYKTLDELSKEELITRWEEADKELLEQMKSARESISFPNFVSGGDIVIEPADFYMQYILHTTYHRGQLLSLLKILGKEGKTTDYLFYLFHLEKQ